MSNSGNAEGGKTNEGNTDVGGVHEDVECPICTQLFYKPVTCPCGHTLCRRCLLKVLDRPGPQCPMCRACFHTGLRDIPVSKVLENVLLRLYPDEYRSVGEAEGNVHGSTESGPRNIPLFVMLAIFPYERMCLNIFEPRYRLLMRRALETNRRFGVAGMNSDGSIAPVITEVELDKCDTTPDGRFLISIHGLSRYSYKRIDNVDGYAVAVDVTPYEDDEEAALDTDREMMEEYHGKESRPGLIDFFYSRIGCVSEIFPSRPESENVEKTSWFTSTVWSTLNGDDGEKLKLLMMKRASERLRVLL